MRKILLFILAILLVEAIVCGALYFEKSNRSSPPAANIANLDELTKSDLKEQIAACKSAEDWAKLGMNFTALGYYPEAKSAYLRAYSLDSESAEIAYDAGFCLSRMGDLEKANELFERAIELNHPRSVEANYFIGRNHLRAENPDAAAASFRNSTKLPIAKFELAKIQFRKKQYEQATQSLRDCLKEQANTPQALTLMSRIKKETGEQREAIATSLDASMYWVRIKTPFALERKRLQDAYGGIGYGRALGKYASDITEMRRAKGQKGLKELNEIEWNLAVQDSLIKVANQFSQPETAAKLINERMERFGPSSEYHAKLGEILVALERTDEAIETWKIGGDLNSDSFGKNCLQNLARYFEEVDPDLEKSKIYQRVGILGFARQGLQYGKFQNSERVALEGIDLDPNSSEMFYILGQAQVALAKMDAAISSFKKCLELEPTHGRARMQLQTLGVDPNSTEK